MRVFHFYFSGRGHVPQQRWKARFFLFNKNTHKFLPKCEMQRLSRIGLGQYNNLSSFVLSVRGFSSLNVNLFVMPLHSILVRQGTYSTDVVITTIWCSDMGWSSRHSADLMLTPIKAWEQLHNSLFPELTAKLHVNYSFDIWALTRIQQWCKAMVQSITN